MSFIEELDGGYPEGWASLYEPAPFDYHPNWRAAEFFSVMANLTGHSGVLVAYETSEGYVWVWMVMPLGWPDPLAR